MHLCQKLVSNHVLGCRQINQITWLVAASEASWNNVVAFRVASQHAIACTLDQYFVVLSVIHLKSPFDYLKFGGYSAERALKGLAGPFTSDSEFTQTKWLYASTFA
jgi:hypothetical protein